MATLCYISFQTLEVILVFTHSSFVKKPYDPGGSLWKKCLQSLRRVDLAFRIKTLHPAH